MCDCLCDVGKGQRLPDLPEEHPEQGGPALDAEVDMERGVGGIEVHVASTAAQEAQGELRSRDAAVSEEFQTPRRLPPLPPPSLPCLRIMLQSLPC